VEPCCDPGRRFRALQRFDVLISSKPNPQRIGFVKFSSIR
jgi:hypothetical protein